MLSIILSSLISMNVNAQAKAQSGVTAAPQQQQQIVNKNPQQRSVNSQRPPYTMPSAQPAVSPSVKAGETFSSYKSSEGGRPLSPHYKATAPAKPDSNFKPQKGFTGSHVMWGMLGGKGYCYEWTNQGDVLNAGAPIDNANCSEVIPSYFDWGFGENGYGYCYEFTPDGYVLNNGDLVPLNNCERIAPSYYTWDRAQDDGNVYCYRKTGNYDYLMNFGETYPNNFCRKPKFEQQQDALQQQALEQQQQQKFAK